MRVLPLQAWVMVLRGDDPQGIGVSEEDKAAALELLKENTGQDFGYDAAKWDQWLRANKQDKYLGPGD